MVKRKGERRLRTHGEWARRLKTRGDWTRRVRTHVARPWEEGTAREDTRRMGAARENAPRETACAYSRRYIYDWRCGYYGFG